VTAYLRTEQAGALKEPVAHVLRGVLRGDEGRGDEDASNRL
jgi:hypothetical protein